MPIRFCRLTAFTLQLGALLCLTLSLANPPAQAGPPRTSYGGGFAGAGLNGEYFANPSLAGSPVFTRRDVRLDFDWAAGGPGGSPAETYRSFPAHGFSARWTGQVLPRFSETYTFTGSPGLHVQIKAPGGAWATVTNNGQPGKMRLASGQAFDLKADYRRPAGAAVLRLAWACPSAGAEIIDPAGGLASNAYTGGFTDAMKSARDEWKTTDYQKNAPRDAHGWPLSDAACLVWEGWAGHQGTYRLSFHGKADLDAQFGLAKFSDQKYDPATNTTTATMTITDTGPENFNLIFKNTYRDGKTGPGTGVTDVKLMTPTAPGAATPFPLTSLFRPDLRFGLRRYTALRFMAGTNWNSSVNWSEETPPDYSTQHLTHPGESGFEANGMAWEYKIALCNETGKDLYANIPMMASDDYVTKVAQCVKYGSDGHVPYTSPQAHPIYPPLNSNLNVYVENSNEVWNYSFAQWKQNFDAAQAAVKGGTPEGKILTFDGNTDGNVDWNRRYALRCAHLSMIFRSVFGDAAMGDKIRPLMEWQYANDGWPPTAQTEITFLNDYFNNGDGKAHVTTPHPVSYYLWGAGGAAYYGAANGEGITDLLPDGGFETPGGWTFTGTAGITGAGSTMGGPDPQKPDPNDKKALPNTHMAYVQGTGSVSLAWTAPAHQTSDVYALRFGAVQRKKPGASGSDGQTLDVYVDGKKITHANTWEGFDRPGSDWGTYITEVFTAEPGSTHTLKFVGLSKNAADAAFLDNVTLTSADAIFASDFPEAGYTESHMTSYNWAHLYGLRGVAYEGGWALGGDGGGSPLQNWVKFHDPRAKDVQMRAISDFYKSGGDMFTFGTYSQSDGGPNEDHEPLPAGIDAANDQLPDLPLNAVAVPGTLTPAQVQTAWGNHDDTGQSGTVGTNTRMVWNLLVPAAGAYAFRANTGAGGDGRLILDGATVPAQGTGGTLSGTAHLTPGLHTLRLQATRGSIPVTGVTVGKAAAATARR